MLYQPDIQSDYPGCISSVWQPIEQYCWLQFCVVGWPQCCMRHFFHCNGPKCTVAAEWSCRCLWLLEWWQQSCFLWGRSAGRQHTQKPTTFFIKLLLKVQLIMPTINTHMHVRAQKQLAYSLQMAAGKSIVLQHTKRCALGDMLGKGLQETNTHIHMRRVHNQTCVEWL